MWWSLVSCCHARFVARNPFVPKRGSRAEASGSLQGREVWPEITSDEAVHDYDRVWEWESAHIRLLCTTTSIPEGVCR
jgi:hypothetical protein